MFTLAEDITGKLIVGKSITYGGCVPHKMLVSACIPNWSLATRVPTCPYVESCSNRQSFCQGPAAHVGCLIAPYLLSYIHRRSEEQPRLVSVLGHAHIPLY